MAFYSVFVGHLHPETRKHELRDLFEKCGPVRDLFIRPNDTGGAHSYGFVRYAELAHAERAIRELHRWEVNGLAIIVQMAKDTTEKLRREKEVEERLVGVNSRSASSKSKLAAQKPNIVENTMYLARVRESCTTLGMQSPDIENSVSNLIDDIQKADMKKSATQWGPLVDPVTNFDHVTQKLIARSQETGENISQRRMGAKKATEFISSLKTIMQEIEDFLSHTASSATNIVTELSEMNSVDNKIPESEATESRSAEGKMAGSESEFVGAEMSEEIEKRMDQDLRAAMVEEMGKKQDQVLSAQNFGCGAVEERGNNSAPVYNSHDGRHYIGSDNIVNDIGSVNKNEQLKYLDVPFENKENEMVSDGSKDGPVENKGIFSCKVKPFGSGLAALTRSPVYYIGSDTDQEVTVEAPKISDKKSKHSQETKFYLTDLQCEQDDYCQELEFSEAVTQKMNVSKAFRAVKSVESEPFISSSNEEKNVEYNNIQRRAQSAGSDLYKEDKANSGKDIEAIQRTESDTRLADSMTLEALFAKLPPLSSFKRSDSQDSSLSEDSFEGVDDSGVESDFRPNFTSQKEHSEHLKTILGIKTSAADSPSQMMARRTETTSHQRMKDFKKQLNLGVGSMSRQSEEKIIGRGKLFPSFTAASRGRGRMFNL